MSLALDIHLSGGLQRTLSIACGVVIARGWPIVNLSESLVNSAVAAITFRHLGHLDAIGSSFFDR